MAKAKSATAVRRFIRGLKPGRSGNPHGRSAGRPNTKTTVERVINETVPVREGRQTRNMTKLEAMLQAHTMKAMKGDARSASIVIGLLTRMGLLGESETETLAVLSEEDDAILADYVRRHTGPPNAIPQTIWRDGDVTQCARFKARLIRLDSRRSSATRPCRLCPKGIRDRQSRRALLTQLAYRGYVP